MERQSVADACVESGCAAAVLHSRKSLAVILSGEVRGIVIVADALQHGQFIEQRDIGQGK